MDEIENEIVDYFAELIKTIDFEQALADPSIVFYKLYNTFSNHVEFIDALFSSDSNSSLVSKVLNKLIEMTSDAAVEHFRSDPEKTEVITRFIFAGEIVAYAEKANRSGLPPRVYGISRHIGYCVFYDSELYRRKNRIIWYNKSTSKQRGAHYAGQLQQALEALD